MFESTELSLYVLLGYLLLVNLFVMAVYVILGFCLAQWMPATYAILRRNFAGYFTNPTGYVFLIVFVILTSAAAFCTDEFLNANLANLDQLNYWLPIILLVFVPSITMSIWAQEQQQGTDELLLTLPATDFDVVLGKYLAAVGVYTAALLYSHATEFTVLSIMSDGDIDLGLFTSTYLGYWLMGLAMLSLGMVCSFVTSNLTVAFILGSLVNAPFALASVVGTAVPALFQFASTDPSGLARSVAQWGYYEQFASFGRGVISLSSVLYFVMIVVGGIYLSLALLGQRHWSVARSGKGNDQLRIALEYGLIGLQILSLVFVFALLQLEVSRELSVLAGILINVILAGVYFFFAETPEAPGMFQHHLLRLISLVAMIFAFGSILSTRDYRIDLTQGQTSSLSSDTLALIANLDGSQQVTVEAYISKQIPEPYVQARYDLITMLTEMQAASGGKVSVKIHDNLELSGELAERADKHYGIKPEEVDWSQRGIRRKDNVLLGAAFRRGLQRSVVRFVSNGVPVEYELARALSTVAQEKKKKLGVLLTDAEMFGITQPGPGNMLQVVLPRQQILSELEEQYEVVAADPNIPLIDKGFDVLLAVQPSSLNQAQMDNLTKAVVAGVPTAIFEDPLPISIPERALAPGTDEPRNPDRVQALGRRNFEPKGNIRKFFKVLGVNLVGEIYKGEDLAATIWQFGCPYPKMADRGFKNEDVFVTRDQKPERANAREPFNPKQPIVAGMREVLLPFPGAIDDISAIGVTFTPLLVTGENSGKIAKPTLMPALYAEFGVGRPRQEGALAFVEGKASGKQWVLAAAIEKKVNAGVEKDEGKKSDKSKEHANTDKAGDESEKKYGGLKAVVVADIDMLSSNFVQMRARPNPDLPVNFRFQNISFVLNVIDWLAGEERFLAVRNRQTRFGTLVVLERATQEAWRESAAELHKYEERSRLDAGQKQAELNRKVAELRAGAEELKNDPVKRQKAEMELALTVGKLMREHQTFTEANEREKKRVIDRIDKQRDAKISTVKSQFRFWPLAAPPIPIVLVGIGVYVLGMVRENLTLRASPGTKG